MRSHGGPQVNNTVSNETRFLHALEMGLGAWQWGDRIMWQYGRGYDDQDVHAAFQSSLEQGIRFVDTAEIYGSGRSERLLGQFLKGLEQPILIATKFFPFPWRFTGGTIVSALKHSLLRLQVETVDLYQIHFPTPLLSPERMMEGMRTCVEQGLTRTVGVSNFSQSQMLRAYSTLARHNVPLASNQVSYSLLNRSAEKSGLLARCQELGIRLIAYSPLEKGLLTGKYSPEKPPPGPRGAEYGPLLRRIGGLLKVMTEIGQDHGGKSNAQIALNWTIAKGTLPIPGAKTARQAIENAGALGWKLTDQEVARLDELSDQV
jgi:aryl-alcohol dehydrogenase-like predicted oxidoreductase